jgi:acyl-[acyl-carrier-protein] desaturase
MVAASETYGGVSYGTVGIHEEVPVVAQWTQTQLLHELEPVVERELNRHLSQAREWFPHAYVPWSEGRDFDGPLDGEAWDPSQSRVSDVARTALVVNLLTEDNLPSYHREIYRVFGADGAWGTWVGRWTAEEGRHGMAIRDYLLTTRAVDPVSLERERMVHMTEGYQGAEDLDMLHTVAYVSFQELATRISHRNTGKYTDDPVADRLLGRIAQDENLHMVFYRNLLASAFEIAPEQTMQAVWDIVSTFAMPGAGLENFARRSVQIAMAGIYDLRIHRDEVLAPILRAWKVWDAEGLTGEAEAARERLAAYLEDLDDKASRFEEKREKHLARQAERVG